jgi:hypothetical protein
MPVIRHQAIGGDADLGLSLGLGQNLLKRGVISGFLKQGKSPNPTVQDMIGEISSSKAWTARHADVLPNPPRSCQEKTPGPFYQMVALEEVIA